MDGLKQALAVTLAFELLRFIFAYAGFDAYTLSIKINGAAVISMAIVLGAVLILAMRHRSSNGG